MDTEYNGWKNRQTWNVALRLGNDEYLYRKACEYVRSRKGKKCTYMGFIRSQGLDGTMTPDGISWSGLRLDLPALNDMMLELIG